MPGGFRTFCAATNTLKPHGPKVFVLTRNQVGDHLDQFVLLVIVSNCQSPIKQHDRQHNCHEGNHDPVAIQSVLRVSLDHG